MNSSNSFEVPNLLLQIASTFFQHANDKGDAYFLGIPRGQLLLVQARDL